MWLRRGARGETRSVETRTRSCENLTTERDRTRSPASPGKNAENCIDGRRNGSERLACEGPLHGPGPLSLFHLLCILLVVFNAVLIVEHRVASLKPLFDMDQDQGMTVHNNTHDDYSFVYPHDLHSYNSSSSSSFILEGSGVASPRFNNSADTFGSPPRHEQHEVEHVYNSPPLALDPSTLDLRSKSNEIHTSSSGIPSGSNSSTPTGSLRLSTYNPQEGLSSSGVTTRRKARATLEHLQIQIDVGVHPEADPESQNPQQQSDLHDIRMQSGGDMQIAVDERDTSFNNHSGGPMDHEHVQGGTTAQLRDMYSLLPGSNTQAPFYLTSSGDGFSNPPISPSSPPEVSREPSMQSSSKTGIKPPSSGSSSIARSFRPGPLSLGLSGNRMIHPPSNLASPVQQQLSPLHTQPPQLSSHPHMHPSPYYPMQHQSTSSPGFPSTPTTSHHTQGSSSSSHSSGHTRYSFRGSPAPRAFGSRHARSSSFGTVSTMSVRSTSPANSVTSALTSLSGGGSGSGGAPASATVPTGSPTSYGENTGDVSMAFEDTAPPPRAQSHPPLSMPTAHPALTAYSSLLPPPRKSLLQHSSNGYVPIPGDEQHPPQVVWPSPDDYPSPPPGPRMTEEEFQAQFRPKPIITRAPHRKQKLANSDRKAICMYAKQHPNARQEDIAARYNVERSTISKILKNKERWLGCPDDEAKVARKRRPRFDDLELVLKHWVEETRDEGLILSDALIRSKAKEEARLLGISEDKFKASSGWLENFKHRVGIRKGKYVGREQWLPASDSDNEEQQRLSLEELQRQRVVFMTDPPPRYDRVKAYWPGASPDVPRQSQEMAGQSHLEQQPSVPAQPSEAARESLEPASRTRTDGRPSGVGMRKTRSRTLAEAREAALAGAPTSPTTELAPGGTNASERVLPSTPSRDFSQPPPSSTSQSPAVDGREASAGLDVALDFIGCQPEGFATPEEVAVLQKLSRRMSRAEPPLHLVASSGPSGWNATVGS